MALVGWRRYDHLAAGDDAVGRNGCAGWQYDTSVDPHIGTDDRPFTDRDIGTNLDRATDVDVSADCDVAADLRSAVDDGLGSDLDTDTDCDIVTDLDIVADRDALFGVAERAGADLLGLLDLDVLADLAVVRYFDGGAIGIGVRLGGAFRGGHTTTSL